MKPKNNTIQNLGLIALTFAGLSSHSAQAANVGWSGGTSSSWNTATNWTPNAVPTSSDIAVFSLAAYANQPNAGTNSVAGLQIGDGTTVTGALALSGTSLTLGTSGISMLANSGAATISSPLVLGAAQSWSNTSGSTLAISGAVTRNVGAAVNFVPTGVINLAGSGLANDGSGILGGWAAVGNAGTAGASGDWAAVDGSGNVITYAGYTNITTNMGAGSYSAQNWKNSVANVALTASATVNSLVVTQDFSVSSGATMTLGSGGLIVSGASRWLKNNGAGTTAGTGQITSGLGSGELFIDSSGSASTDSDWRIWTKVVDNGGTAVKLVKNGPGYLRLANSNSYTGGTIVNGGALVGDGGSAFGTGAVQVNSGAVTVNLNAGTMANNFTVATGSSVTIDNATNNGTLNGSFSGGGTVTIQNTSAANLSENVNGSWNGFTGTLNYNTASKVVNIFGSASMDLSNAAVNFTNTGNLTNSSFRTSGTGTTKFGSLAGFGYLFDNGATEIGNLGTNTTFSGVVSAAGSITKVGSGTLTLSGANTYTGGTAVNGGKINLAIAQSGTTSGPLGASGTISFGGGALQYSSSNTTDYSARIASGTSTGAVAIDTNGQSVTFATALTASQSGGLTKSGTGTLTLTGANAYTGGTSVSAGTLALSGSGTFSTGSLTSSGGTIDLGTKSITNTLGALTGGGAINNGTITNNAGTYDMQNGSVGAILAGSNGLTKSTAGTVTLSGANIYTGATLISGGTLALGSTGSISNTSGVSLGTSGTFDVSAKSGGYTVNNLSGSGNVTGALTVSTQLAIGNSPGTVNFSGDLTLGSASSYIYELTGGGTTADLGDVGGALSITTGAVLDLVQLGTYTANDKFTLFAYDGGLAGNFAGLADDTVFNDAGGDWLINYNDTIAGLNGGSGTSYVTITAVPEPGAALLGGLGVLALLRRRRN